MTGSTSFIGSIVLLFFLLSVQHRQAEAKKKILVYSYTGGWRHDSIFSAKMQMRRLQNDYNLDMTFSENPDIFENSDRLNSFDAVVFLSTTADIVTREGQENFQNYIRSGGGYVGIHAAADAEYDWEWYGDLVGAFFESHCLVCIAAKLEIENHDHISTKHFEKDSFYWPIDEFYNFDRNPRTANNNTVVLLTLDEDKSFGFFRFTRRVDGNMWIYFDDVYNMGDDHPIAWYKEFDGGRSWYTNLGHSTQLWYMDFFLDHVMNGIVWAAAGSEEVISHVN